ncbi:MAG: hypothetical protein R3195_18420 [Gemmatimonadota bacterium]|nr:hypothetical protein [Gemmatimonadota bacterium]
MTRGLAARRLPPHLAAGALLFAACAGPEGQAATTRTTAATGEMAHSVSAETPTQNPGAMPAITLDGAITPDEWKADLARIAGDAWITSNDAYRSETEPAVAYATAMRLQPGGLSATGCLWSIHADETTAIQWRFFQAWDPVRQTGMLYQSSAGGMVGFGHFQQVEGEPELVQDFSGPGGTAFRAGHFETWDGDDTRISRSVNRDGDVWAPRREYTWHRDPDATIPCDEWR